MNQVAKTLQTFPNSNGTFNLIAGSVTYSSTLGQNLSTVTILTNSGSGTFSAQTLLSNSTWQVAEVDYLSLAGTPTLLLLGTDGTARTSTYSGGAFATPVSFNLNLPTGIGAPSGVLSFVLNGNTCFAGITNGDVFIWLGNSDGSFQTPHEQGVAAYSPVQLTTADINGDGFADLVVLGGGPFTTMQQILPLYGSSSGVFSSGIETGPGVYGSQLVIGDANSDGHPDLLLSEANQGITVLLNQGDGSFPHPTTFASPAQIVSSTPVPDYPVAVATADLNGDGLPDLVVANGLNPSTQVNTNTVSTFLNEGNGVFTYVQDVPVSTQPVALTQVTIAGKVYVFVINATNGNVDLLQGNGDGTFTSQGTFTGGSLAGANALAIASGPIGPSGSYGVVVGDSSGGLTVFTPSNGSWSATAQYTTSSGAPITSIALQDVNGDGIPDLLVALGATPGYNSQSQNIVNSGSILVFAGTGDGTFSNAVSIKSSQANWNPGFVTAGSLTGSAAADIVVVNGSYCGPCTLAGLITPPKTLAIFSGTSLTNRQETDLGSPLDGIATQTASPSIPTQSAAIGDVNADGTKDLVVSYGGLVGVLPGKGSGAFAAPVVQVASTDTAGFVNGSFFDPGIHDLVVASSQGVTPLQSLQGKNTTGGSPYADFTPVSLTFQKTTVGNPVSMPVTLTNTGIETLTVSKFIIQADANGDPAPEFTVAGVECGSVANPASVALAPNASCTFTIQFNPTAAVNYSAQLVFTDNGEEGDITSTQVGSASYQQVIPITGVGVTGPILISPSSLPAATLNAAYSQVISATGGTAGFTFSESGALPSGITLNAATGTLSGTPTKAGTFPISITAKDSSGDSSSTLYQFVVDCPSFLISPSSGTLPVASIGLGYLELFTVSGATGTLSWSSSGNLPQGVQFNGPAAELYGIVAPPTGPHSFTLAVTDSAGCTVSDNYVISVQNALSVVANLPAASVGVAYTGSFSASGGTAPYTYAFDTVRPPGLTLNAQTGTLTGAPTQVGTFAVGIIATDSLGVQVAVSANLVVQPVTLSITDNETITVSDGTPQVQLIDVTDSNEVITVTDTVVVQVTTPAIPVIVFTPPAGGVFTAGTPFSGTLTFGPLAGTIARAPSAREASQNAASSASSVFAGTIHFSSSDPRAILPHDYTYTAADNGSHTFNFTLFTAGKQTVTYVDIANTSLTGTTTVPITAGSPAAIVPSAGTPQTALIGSTYATAFSATVTDRDRNPIAGARVRFTAPARWASGTFAGSAESARATTDNNGVATAPAFTANSTPGIFAVTATTAGVAFPAIFLLANTKVAIPALPTFSPAGGSFESAQSVAVADVTAGASIYYTTDGTRPTSMSTLYTQPISVATTETIKAIAVLNSVSSAVAQATYFINASRGEGEGP